MRYDELAAEPIIYSYNGDGQRVRKFSSSGASSTVIFVYGQSGELLGEYTSTGAAIREYIYVDGAPVAMFTPPTSGSTPVVFYLHTDHLDTPRVATDTAGNIRWRWMSEPFGTTAPEDNPSGLGAITQPLRMPGQYADAESGLFYNLTRNLDTTLNRYNQFDSIGLAGGINGFSYVMNNPLSFVDPDGRQAQALPIIIPGLAIGCYFSPGCRDLFKPREPKGGPDAPLQSTPIPPQSPTLPPQGVPKDQCPPTEEECRKEWLEAENICFEWIQELKSTRISARRRKILLDLTGGSMGACKMGQVSQACGGNKVKY